MEWRPTPGLPHGVLPRFRFPRAPVAGSPDDMGNLVACARCLQRAAFGWPRPGRYHPINGEDRPRLVPGDLGEKQRPPRRIDRNLETGDRGDFPARCLALAGSHLERSGPREQASAAGVDQSPCVARIGSGHGDVRIVDSSCSPRAGAVFPTLRRIDTFWPGRAIGFSGCLPR